MKPNSPTLSPQSAIARPGRERMTRLLRTLQQGIYDKENETALALLAALSGESLLLLGPPGVAKSMVARRLKEAFLGARSFEYLMSRFSTPDELFGPVSIARLKASDKYERATEGFLPTADVVFLDEIWKAGPAIQNTLLTVMNEKLFRNGDQELRLPLKLLVAASNELPAKGEGLEALWDRFLLRVVCRNISDEAVFRQMLCEEEGEKQPPETETADPRLTAAEYAVWQAEARRLPLSSAVLDAISHLRARLQRVEIEGSDLARAVYVSDRRWKHIARLLRTSAYVQGRAQAEPADLYPLYHCLWNEPEEIAEVRRLTLQAIFAPLAQRLEQLSQGVKADLRACRAQAALAKAVREHDHRDDGLLIVDRFFYQIENHGTGNTYVFITDFKRMPPLSREHAPAQGLLYTDPSNPQRRIVRMFSPDWQGSGGVKEKEHVTLCRDDAHIYLNGVRFKMRQVGRADLSPAAGKVGSLFAQPATQTVTTKAAKPVSSDRYEAEAEEIVTALDALAQSLTGNLFVCREDGKLVGEQLQAFYKQVALCRVDIRKLLYDDEA